MWCDRHKGNFKILLYHCINICSCFTYKFYLISQFVTLCFSAQPMFSSHQIANWPKWKEFLNIILFQKLFIFSEWVLYSKKSIQAISFLLLWFSFNEQLLKPEIVFHIQVSQRPPILYSILSPVGFSIHFTLSSSPFAKPINNPFKMQILIFRIMEYLFKIELWDLQANENLIFGNCFNNSNFVFKVEL